jgi:hypothetical protein
MRAMSSKSSRDERTWRGGRSTSARQAGSPYIYVRKSGWPPLAGQKSTFDNDNLDTLTVVKVITILEYLMSYNNGFVARTIPSRSCRFIHDFS